MLFIFGIRSTPTGATVLKGCSCPNCNQQDMLSAVFKANYFHLFFVPFFPTGKSCVITCSYCRKEFDDKYLPPAIGAAIEKFKASEQKRPAWHCCGCSLVLILLALFFIIGAIGYFSDSKPEKSNPFEKNYKADFDKMTASPDCKTDSISCTIKTYLDLEVNDQMNTDAFEYFSRADGSKVLVLMRVRDMKKVEGSARKDLVNEICHILKAEYQFQDGQIYIGVEGKWNTVLVYTPRHKQLDGHFANEEYLYDFYESNPEKQEMEIDTANIKIKKIQ